MKSLTSILSVGVLTFLGSPMGMAAGVTVTSSNYNPFVGTQFTVTLRGTNFVNMGAGTVSMAWDASKASLSAPNNSACASCLPATGPVGVGTGSFIQMHLPTFDVLPGAPPVNGNFDFAVFTFNALAAGPLGLVFGDDGGIQTGWFDNSTADPISVSYENALITVQTPIPTAVWLFASALGLMGWLRRRTG